MLHDVHQLMANFAERFSLKQLPAVAEYERERLRVIQNSKIACRQENLNNNPKEAAEFQRAKGHVEPGGASHWVCLYKESLSHYTVKSIAALNASV